MAVKKREKKELRAKKRERKEHFFFKKKKKSIDLKKNICMLVFRKSRRGLPLLVMFFFRKHKGGLAPLGKQKQKNGGKNESVKDCI